MQQQEITNEQINHLQSLPINQLIQYIKDNGWNEVNQIKLNQQQRIQIYETLYQKNVIDFVNVSMKYPNQFKAVPLANDKRCYVKGHQKQEIGYWLNEKSDYNDFITTMTNLSSSFVDVGIHTTEDVIIIDVDSYTKDEKKYPLSHNQKQWLAKQMGTFAHYTIKGIHLIFNNDSTFEKVDGRGSFTYKGVTFNYDIRGNTSTYIGLKHIENGIVDLPMQNISQYNFINLVEKIDKKQINYDVSDEIIKIYFDEPEPEIYQRDMQIIMDPKLNVIEGKNVQQIIDEGLAQGWRHNTIRQILLRGANLGVNYHVLVDVADNLNNSLFDPLPEDRMTKALAIDDTMKNNYKSFEYKRTHQSSNSLATLRCKVNKITASNGGKKVIDATTTRSTKDGEIKYTNYSIYLDSMSSSIQEKDNIELTVTNCNYTTQYKDKEGNLQLLKNAKYIVNGFPPKKIEEEKGLLFGLSIKGKVIKPFSVNKNNYAEMLILDKNEKFLKISLANNEELELPNMKGKILNIPLSSFKSKKIENDTYISNATITEGVAKNLSKFEVNINKYLLEFTKVNGKVLNCSFNDIENKSEIEDYNAIRIEISNENFNLDTFLKKHNFEDCNIRTLKSEINNSLKTYGETLFRVEEPTNPLKRFEEFKNSQNTEKRVELCKNLMSNERNGEENNNNLSIDNNYVPTEQYIDVPPEQYNNDIPINGYEENTSVNNNDQQIITQNSGDDTPLNNNLPILKMRVSFISNKWSFSVVNGYTSRQNPNTGDWIQTYYEVTLQDSSKLRAKDIIEVPIKKLEYKKSYINKDNEEVMLKNPKFIASGNKAKIVTDSDKNHFLGITLQGTIKTTYFENNQFFCTLEKSGCKDIILKTSDLLENGREKEVSIPLTNFVNGIGKVPKNVNNSNIEKFEKKKLTS